MTALAEGLGRACARVCQGCRGEGSDARSPKDLMLQVCEYLGMFLAHGLTSMTGKGLEYGCSRCSASGAVAARSATTARPRGSPQSAGIARRRRRRAGHSAIRRADGGRDRRRQAKGGCAPATTQPVLPPGVEVEVDFEQPQASERFVYAANPDTGTVAIIDATSQAIQTIETGDRPTFLRTLAGTDDAIVLNVGSDDATILRSPATGAKLTHVGRRARRQRDRASRPTASTRSCTSTRSAARPRRRPAACCKT